MVLPDDLIELAGFLLSAWLTGYAMGFLIYAFRRFTDQI